MTNPSPQAASDSRAARWRAVALGCVGAGLATAALAFALELPPTIVWSCLGGMVFGLALAPYVRRWLNASAAPEVHGPDAVRPTSGDTRGAAALDRPAEVATGVGGFNQDLLERVNSAAQAAGVRIFDWDLLNNRLTLDQTRLHVYSASAQDVATDPLEFTRRIVHPDDLQRFQAEMIEALKRKDRFVLSYRALQADGRSTRPVQLHGQVSRDSNGRAVRVLGITVDMSSQVEAAQRIEQQAAAQRQMLQRLDLATRTAGIGVWDMDAVTGAIDPDAIARDLFGFEEECDEQALVRLIHPDDREEAVHGTRRRIAACEHGGMVSVRHRVTPPNRPIRHVQSHLLVSKDANGRPVRILGATWDVTAEFERAEELQRQAHHVQKLNDRLSVATSSAGVSPWELDLATQQFVWDANRPKVFGLDTVPIEGMFAALSNIMVPEDRKQVIATIGRAIAAGDQAFPYRFRVRATDGSVHHMQSYARVLRNEQGAPRGLLGATLDVTSEVETHALLERQAEQEHALIDRLNIATQAAGISAWELDAVTRRFLWIENPIHILAGVMAGGASLEAVHTALHPDDRDVFDAELATATSDKRDRMSYRYRAHVSDGKLAYIQSHARLIWDDSQGRVLRILGVCWDVTREIEAALKLEDQARHERMLRDRLSLAAETAGISSWEVDVPAQRFIMIEDSIRALHGVLRLDGTVEEFVADVIPEDRGIFDAVVRTAYYEGRDRVSYKYRVRAADGSIVHVQAHARLIMDEKRRLRKLLGLSWDITKEIEAAERLRQQGEHERMLLDRLSMATEAAGICSWETDLDTNRFLWTENWLKALGGDPESASSSDDFVATRFHPVDRDAIDNAIRETLQRKGDRFSCRYRAIGVNGNVVHVQSHARLMIGEDGRAHRLLGVSWDITGEIAAAERLEAQARHERMLLDRLSIATQAADISSWEIDLVAKRFLSLENPIRALSRARESSLSLDELGAIVVEEDRDVMTIAMKRARAEGSDRMAYSYRAHAPDGRLVHVKNFCKLVYDERSRPVRAFGVSWDVTSEVEAAARLAQQTQQLQDAERRLERASLSSFEGHWESDFATGRMWFSSSYHALLGYPDGQLPFAVHEFTNLVHADDLAMSRTALAEHLSQATNYMVDLRLRTASGEYRWFRLRGAAERDRDGKPVTMSGSIQDVHEQKLTADALRRAQSRFERAMNGTQDGLWELEASGDAWSSPRIAELLGYAHDELPGTTHFLRDFLHSDDASLVAAATQAHFEEAQPYDVEIRLRTKCGEYRWYRARATAERDANGKPLRLSGSLQDVTEARFAREELLRATEAAEAANRAKSEFLANVSHEIRTPMNGIIGMTGLLLDTALDRAQRDYADTIRASADSLLTVINDILDFSKIEAGKLDIDAIELDLRGNVEDVGAMMAFQAAAKNLELVIHVHPDVADRVIGDPQRIRQCLINLVGNAIKFTRAGEIVIEVRNTAREGGKVLTQFEVRDTGIGIAPNTLATLFQPFVQADSSTTRHFGGTGLGLSIVRRLVDMMHGQVGTESELGKGSTFWFALPLEPVAVATSAAQPDLARLGRRVLVVDDNDTNRRVLAGQLMHAGYEVSLAGGGNEALTLMRQALADTHPFEVVLADYQMHDMDGAVLGERINADPGLSRARMVMLTSMDRQGDVHRFASLGFAAYLTKPVRARELFECLDRVLAREAREWHLQSQPIVTRGTLVSHESTRRYNASVLLVEDNAVNQKVAVRFLERMGCKVRVADNGAQAVKAYREGTFDIVLMDLQMPVMDGLTATRRIREIEAGGRATPIVALTANAMTGQLERCMDAGMSGFLTKPLDIMRLHETFDRFGFGVSGADPREATVMSGATAVPVDLVQLNEITDGDAEFAHELASTFISSGEEVLREIHAALAAFDRVALSRAAHKLKGASANIHAEPLRELAFTVETQAAQLDQPRLHDLVERLQSQFQRAAEFLQANVPPPAARAG